MNAKQVDTNPQAGQIPKDLEEGQLIRRYILYILYMI